MRRMLFPVRAAHRWIVAWVACVAILMPALAPAMSRAMSADSTAWADICSADRGDPSGASGERQPLGGHGFAGHCPYCSLHLDMQAPVPQMAVVHQFVRFEAPRLFFLAPRPLHAWASANPRAPPTHV